MAARGWEGDADGATLAARRDASRNDDDQPRGDGESAEAGSAPSQPPTKRKRNQLSESHLLGQEGFKKIYQTFPYHTSSSVAGQEAKALSSLITMYKQWAYDLYPGLNFEDFIDRTEALGKTHGVQGLMSDLRTKEMRRALGLPEDDSLLPAADEDVAPREPEPEESGFIVPGGDDYGDDDGSSEEEAML